MTNLSQLCNVHITKSWSRCLYFVKVLSANVFYWSFLSLVKEKKKKCHKSKYFWIFEATLFRFSFWCVPFTCLMYTFQLFDNTRSRWDEIFFFRIKHKSRYSVYDRPFVMTNIHSYLIYNCKHDLCA